MKRSLEELMQIGRMGIGTSISDPINSINGLIDLCNYVGIADKIMCEIGCFVGISTETFLNFNPKKLYAIDPWGLNDSYKEANWSSFLQKGGWNFIELEFKNMASNYSNIEIIKDFSENAVSHFEDKSLDLVYIDGWHSKADKDFELWIPKVKIGGYLTGHDASQVKIKLFSDDSWAVKVLKNIYL